MLDVALDDRSSTSNPFGDVRVRADERTAALRALQSMALVDTLRGLHPRLIPVHIFEDHVRDMEVDVSQEQLAAGLSWLGRHLYIHGAETSMR